MEEIPPFRHTILMMLQQEHLRMGANHLQPTDSDLIRRATGGDDAAFHELVDRHAPSLYRLAFSLVGNAADAEDVLQETFAGAFRQLGKFQGRAALRTWLSQILVRQAARCRRSRRRAKMVSLDALSETARELLKNGTLPPAGRESDLRLDVLTVLDTLSPDHREVVVLRELHGMSYDEMADVLRVPRGTVESRLFRARQELKQRLKDYLP